MKKIAAVILITIISLSAAAQYKKASFFTRNNKFIGVKTGMNLYGNGVKATPLFAFIYGKDKGENRIWHWWDLEITGSSKYSYNALSSNTAVDAIVNVSGKVSPMLTWRYNWAFYLGNNKDEEKKGLPFVKIAVEAALFGRFIQDEKTTPTGESAIKTTYSEGSNMGIDLGAGYSYKLGENFKLFGVAGYRWLYNETTQGSNIYFTTPSHPFVNIGIRFSGSSND
jgi:hypothetical protein